MNGGSDEFCTGMILISNNTSRSSIKSNESLESNPTLKACQESVVQNVSLPPASGENQSNMLIYEWHGTIEQCQMREKTRWQEWREQAVPPSHWTQRTIYGTARTASWECHSLSNAVTNTVDKVKNKFDLEPSIDYQLIATPPLFTSAERLRKKQLSRPRNHPVSLTCVCRFCARAMIRLGRLSRVPRTDCPVKVETQVKRGSLNLSLENRPRFDAGPWSSTADVLVLRTDSQDKIEITSCRRQFSDRAMKKRRLELSKHFKCPKEHVETFIASLAHNQARLSCLSASTSNTKFTDNERSVTSRAFDCIELKFETELKQISISQEIQESHHVQSLPSVISADSLSFAAISRAKRLRNALSRQPLRDQPLAESFRSDSAWDNRWAKLLDTPWTRGH